MQKIIVRGAALTLLRHADFSCHAARRGASTAACGRVRCAVAISRVQYKNCLCFRMFRVFKLD